MANSSEISEAKQTLAELSVYELFNPEANEVQTILVLGNYLIMCAIATEAEDNKSIKDEFRDGLIEAGIDNQNVERITDIFNTTDIYRYIFSLSHIPKDYRGNGIKRNKRGVWLEEDEFIKASIALKTD